MELFLILYKIHIMYIMRNIFTKVIVMPATIQQLNSAELADRVGELASRIKIRRKALGVSATAAAEAAGMSRVTWHRIEQGQTSVTIGAWFNALAVLGLQFGIGESSPGPAKGRGDPDAEFEAYVPVRIRLGDYPQLEALAWQVSGSEEVTPQEALDIYSRNRRHMDASAIVPRERALMDALQRVFGDREL